jgi:predicted esterase
MQNRLIVLGGWAFSPEVLASFSSNDYDPVFVDINLLMQDLVCDGALRQDWQQRLKDEFLQKVQKPEDSSIVGWSTGSMLALSLADTVQCNTITCISGCLSFTAHETNPMGWHPTVINRMIKKLQTKRDVVLGDFYKQCGLTESAVETALKKSALYSTDMLCAGLIFLRDARVRIPGTSGHTSIKIIHGEKDVIIHPDAGRLIAEKLGCPCEIIEKGGHGFFI